MKRDSAVIIFKDETGKWHCRFCLGIRSLNKQYRICLTDNGCCFHLNRCCYSRDGGTHFKDHLTFNFNNMKHKIILSSSINLLPITDDISGMVDQCIVYIQKLQESSN